MELYDFYKQGFENIAYEFGYIPEFDGTGTILTYSKGSQDARERKEMLTYDEYEQQTN